jgi:iron complex outermembrane receptor protein
MKVGQSLQSTILCKRGLNENLEVYAFGGTSYREGEAAGFYRRPNSLELTLAL